MCVIGVDKVIIKVIQSPPFAVSLDVIPMNEIFTVLKSYKSINMYMIIVSLSEMPWVEIAKASKPQNYTLEAKFTIPKMRTYVKSSPIYVNFTPIY